MLDALIGNTDRHHENWAAVEDPGPGDMPRLFLAPTFDHASSMGRNEPADRMRMRLETGDSGFSVEAYAGKARSALYSSRDAARPLSPLDAFASAARLAPAGARAWCAQLQGVNDERIMDIIGGVPEQRMTSDAKRFVARMLIYNRKQLEDLCRSL